VYCFGVDGWRSNEWALGGFLFDCRCCEGAGLVDVVICSEREACGGLPVCCGVVCGSFEDAGGVELVTVCVVDRIVEVRVDGFFLYGVWDEVIRSSRPVFDGVLLEC